VASSCFALMAAPGGRIRQRWLRAHVVEAVQGLAERLGGRVASVASPSPLLVAQVARSGSGGQRGGWRRVVASGGQIRRWWLWAHAVETVGGLAERLGGQGGLDSFPLPPPRSVGGRIPSDGPLDGARLAEAVIMDRGVAWEAKWPRLLPQPPRGGSGHARQWPRTTASAVVRRPTPWMAKVER
jgi:hypothetical protein